MFVEFINYRLKFYKNTAKILSVFYTTRKVFKRNEMVLKYILGGKMAFYDESVIEEVKAANDIVDVVSSYVTLKRKGGGFFGLCPFHKEKTGSFSVAPDKQIYHCFGCGEGGNVIRFIMKIENIGFREAIEFLAERANINLPSIDYNSLNLNQAELLKREEDKKQMYAINKTAGRFFY